YIWGGGVYTDQGYGVEDGNKKVGVYLTLRNKKENGLGVPLPAGRIRVNERDADGALEFIGEKGIDHTPRHEDLGIKRGGRVDVVGERRQVHYSMNSNRNTMSEEIEIKLRNQKKVPVKVKVLENLYRATNWDIMEKSHEFKKENAHLISFLVDAPPE